MKSGANFNDVNNIRAYVEAGVTDAAYIGERLGINTQTVQSFVDLYASKDLTRGQKGAATRAANKLKQLPEEATQATMGDSHAAGISRF